MAEMQVGKIAFRDEGDMWNCYWDPMDGREKIWLGSLRMIFVRSSEPLKNQFMDLMRAAWIDMCEEIMGVTPSFTEPEPAPDSESLLHSARSNRLLSSATTHPSRNGLMCRRRPCAHAPTPRG